MYSISNDELYIGIYMSSHTLLSQLYTAAAAVHNDRSIGLDSGKMRAAHTVLWHAHGSQLFATLACLYMQCPIDAVLQACLGQKKGQCLTECKDAAPSSMTNLENLESAT